MHQFRNSTNTAAIIFLQLQAAASHFHERPLKLPQSPLSKWPPRTLPKFSQFSPKISHSPNKLPKTLSSLQKILEIFEVPSIVFQKFSQKFKTTLLKFLIPLLMFFSTIFYLFPLNLPPNI